MNNISSCNSNGDWLREVIMKIGLERINIQEKIIVEVLLDSRVTSLVESKNLSWEK